MLNAPQDASAGTLQALPQVPPEAGRATQSSSLKEVTKEKHLLEKIHDMQIF